MSACALPARAQQRHLRQHGPHEDVPAAPLGVRLARLLAEARDLLPQRIRRLGRGLQLVHVGMDALDDDPHPLQHRLDIARRERGKRLMLAPRRLRVPARAASAQRADERVHRAEDLHAPTSTTAARRRRPRRPDAPTLSASCAAKTPQCNVRAERGVSAVGTSPAPSAAVGLPPAGRGERAAGGANRPSRGACEPPPAPPHALTLRPRAPEAGDDPADTTLSSSDAIDGVREVRARSRSSSRPRAAAARAPVARPRSRRPSAARPRPQRERLPQPVGLGLERCRRAPRRVLVAARPPTAQSLVPAALSNASHGIRMHREANCSVPNAPCASRTQGPTVARRHVSTAPPSASDRST